MSPQSEPFPAFGRPERDALHYQKKSLPGELIRPCIGIKTGNLKGTFFQSFLIENKTVRIPPQNFNHVTFAGEKHKYITRNGRKGHVGLDKPVKPGHAFTHINIMLAQIIMHAIG